MSIFSSKDQKFAEEIGLATGELEKIIKMSRKEFRNFCTNHKSDEEGLNKLKDFRRRIKNKMAARKCRKNQDDFIENLKKQIGETERENECLNEQKNQLNTEKQNLTSQLNQLLTEGRADVQGLVCVRNCPQLTVTCFEEDHVLSVHDLLSVV
jgi:Zn-finger nucleic acid-binding protein